MLSRGRRLWLGFVVLAALFVYSLWCIRIGLSAQAARTWDPAQLERGTRLDPWNFEPWQRLTHLAEIGSGDAARTTELADAAIARNPRASYAWLIRALARRQALDAAGALQATERALRADPNTPMYILAAANIDFGVGDEQTALRQLHRLAEHAPDSLAPAADLAWRATHDARVVLDQVVPGNVQGQLALLRTLVDHDESAAGRVVWERISSEGKNFDPAMAFAYVNYLLAKGQGDDARSAWLWLSKRDAELARYREPGNEVTNPSFEEPILNSAVDWRYQAEPAVSVHVAADQVHGGGHALALEFSGAVEKIGVFQYVPVKPGTTYEFSGYHRTTGLEGAGGIAWSLTDARTGTELTRSEVLASADAWRQTEFDFHSDGRTDLVLLKLIRVPAGDQLRGTVWIDDLSVVPLLDSTAHHR